jgi:hypothetical protein
LVNQSGHKFKKRLATKGRKRHKEKFRENIEHPASNVLTRRWMLGVGCFHFKGKTGGPLLAARRKT